MSGLNEWQKHPGALLHIISLGVGRQSSAMYLMAVAGEIEPRPDLAIFADTGNEPPHVYEQLEYLMQARFTDIVPIEVVSNGNIYEDSMAAFNGANVWGEGRWIGPPVFVEGGGPLRRGCTEHYKVKPIMARINELRDRRQVVNWRGHTTTELHRAKPAHVKYMTVRWPLLEARMSDNSCAVWIERNGHPAFKWSACEICPFRLNQLDKAKELSIMPETWQRILTIDHLVRDMSHLRIKKRGYMNRANLPMSKFIIQEDTGQMSLFDCDGGACGL